MSEINLGLDLKGYECYPEVSVVDVIRALSNYSKDETFVQQLNLQKKNKEMVKMILLHFASSFDEQTPFVSGNFCHGD